jgi:hypothetical protein
MKYGLSLLLNEYIFHESVEYEDSKIFQIVCPECYEPVFKVVRKEENGIGYFSHYKKDKIIKVDCSLRVDTLQKKQLLDKNNESRGQYLQLFLSVFKSELLRNEFSGDIEKIKAFINQINSSKSFNPFRNLFMDHTISISISDEELLECMNYYINEANLTTEYYKIKQKELAIDFWKHILSAKAKDNFGFLIIFSIIFLDTRLSLSQNINSLSKNERDMKYFLNKLISCKDEYECWMTMKEMQNYTLNPPFVLEKNSNMLIKICSEIMHECLGALIRFPYLKVLQNNLKLQTGQDLA